MSNVRGSRGSLARKQVVGIRPYKVARFNRYRSQILQPTTKLSPTIHTRTSQRRGAPHGNGCFPIRNKPLRVLEAKEAVEAFAPTSLVSTKKARSSKSMTILDLRASDLIQIATLPLTVSDLPDLPGVWPSVWGSFGDRRARAFRINDAGLSSERVSRPRSVVCDANVSMSMSLSMA